MQDWRGPRLLLVQADHPEHVLGGLFPHDVHQVVRGCHPFKPPVVIDHRHGHQVVLLEGARDLFLVRADRHGVDIALGYFAQRGLRQGDQKVADADRALQPAFVVDHVEVVGPVCRRAQHPEVVDRLLDADPFVQRNEAARHNATGGFVVVAHQFGDFFAAIKRRKGLQLFGRLQLLDDVRRHVVINLFEDGWQVLHADSADQVAEFVILGVFEELADDVRRQLVEERDAFFFAKEQDEFGEVCGVQRSDQRNKLGPLATAGQRTGVIQYIAGSNVLCHRRFLWELGALARGGTRRVGARANVRLARSRVNARPLT